jgi:hypothetical protein
MRTVIHLGPRMHTEIETTQITVCILRLDKSRYAFGDSSRSPYHTEIETTQIPVCILRLDKSRYAYGDSSRWSPYAYRD